jgi:GntR family transcriptional regulator
VSRLGIQLDDHGPSIYLQIIQQVGQKVASGELKPGEELPTIRGLAEELQVNPATVARAYQELEHAGVVFKRSTKGTFVSREPDSQSGRRRRQLSLVPIAEPLIEQARALNVPREDLFALIRELLDAKRPRNEER